MNYRWPAYVYRSYRDSADDSLLALIRAAYISRRSRDPRICIVVASDVDARASHTEFAREVWPLHVQTAVLVFSSYVLRRPATLFKIAVLRNLKRPFRLSVDVIALDGFGNLKVRNLGWIDHLRTEWFNSPDEADRYWAARRAVPRKVNEYFPYRDGVPLQNSSPVHQRSYSWPVTALTKGYARDFLPSLRHIVFAGDIRLDVRPECSWLTKELEQAGIPLPDVDELLWSIAHARVNGDNSSGSVNLTEFLKVLNVNVDIAKDKFDAATDGVRLTVHSRERFLYVRALCNSEFSNSVKIIGQQWLQFNEIAPNVASRGRFPEVWPPSDFQRARVCPDFGSSLGMIPNYLRAQILATKTGGLLQLKSHLGNPFIAGIESSRSFTNIADLLTKIELQFSLSENAWLDQVELVRSNYQRCQDEYIASIAVR